MIVSRMTIDQMDDLLYLSLILFVFADQFCLFVEQILPPYCDKDKINFYIVHTSQ